MRLKLFLIVISLFSSFSEAAEKLQRVGSTRFSVLWFDIYDATLYSETGSYQVGQQPLRLTLDYLRDISAQQLLEETRKQWKRNPNLNKQDREQWLAQLEKIWPDIREKEQLSFTLYDDDKGEFQMFGETLGIIDAPGFARAFINIWLGPHSQYPRQARKLTGNGQ